MRSLRTILNSAVPRAIPYVLLGAIMNVAVAWGCSWWRVPQFINASPIEAMDFWPKLRLDAALTRETQMTGLYEACGVTERFMLAYRWSDSEQIRSQARRKADFFVTPYQPVNAADVGDDLRKIHADNAPADRNGLMGIAVREGVAQVWYGTFGNVVDCPPPLRVDAGWPMRAFRGWGPASTSMPPKTLFAVTVVRSKEQQQFVRLLPLLPLWPGFAINTFFYASIMWMLYAVPCALRRKRRRSLRLCPACAYPIGESEVCTECGFRVRDDARESTVK